MLANSMGHITKAQPFLYELAKQHSFRSDTFNTSTLLRAIRRFLKALNFSLNVISCLMIFEVKNEALERSFRSKSWHLSLLKLLLVQHHAACIRTFH